MANQVNKNLLLARRYYKELGLFSLQCRKLIKQGGAYIVIIANHELFRFLYPFEPYLRFRNRFPLIFILDKIKALNKLLNSCSKTIKFYDSGGGYFDEQVKSGERLESKTSKLYTELWRKFGKGTMLQESIMLIKKRIPQEVINNHIKNKIVMDMGCGSGRYSLALSGLGAKKVYALDLSERSYEPAKAIALKKKLRIRFLEGDFLKLPFPDNFFDFVFCNGTLHHSRSIEKGLRELKRILKLGGKAFLYLYAKGGIFWKTRERMRSIFKSLPPQYTNSVLKIMGVPSNRFIFTDIWHVPIETYTSRNEIESLLKRLDMNFYKVISSNPYDLDQALIAGYSGYRNMWGDGEHRYIIEKNE